MVISVSPQASEHEHEPRTDGRGCGTTDDRVEHPTPAGARACEARPDEFGAGAHRDRGDRGSRARSGAEDPGRWRGREEQRGEAEDDRQPWDDEREAADDRAGDACDPPCREDCELRRRRSGQQVARCERVFEVVGAEPLAALDTQAAKQGDVSGRAAEADDADSAPLHGDRQQRSARAGVGRVRRARHRAVRGLVSRRVGTAPRRCRKDLGGGSACRRVLRRCRCGTSRRSRGVVRLRCRGRRR